MLGAGLLSTIHSMLKDEDTVTEPSESRPAPLALSVTAFVLGLVSLAFVVVFVTTSAGAFPVIASIISGLAALVIGITALVKKQSKAFAVTGIVLGSVVALLGLAVIVFALLFVGAITFG